MKAKRHRFPIVVKRGSSVVKIYRDRKASATYYRGKLTEVESEWAVGFIDWFAMS